MACPKCQSTKFYLGPEGGGSQNVLCCQCLTEYCESAFGLQELNSSPERIRRLYGIDCAPQPAEHGSPQDEDVPSMLDDILE